MPLIVYNSVQQCTLGYHKVQMCVTVYDNVQKCTIVYNIVRRKEPSVWMIMWKLLALWFAGVV